MNLPFTLGADPEFFLKNKRNSNRSAHGLVPGTKEEPHKLPFGACQLDGTAVEFNIKPATVAREFEENILSTVREIRRIVPSEYSFNFSPAVFYSEKYFDKIPDDSKRLGCDPDYDAYNKGQPNVMPQLDGKFQRMRTGAGHLHIGFTDVRNVFDPSHMFDCIMLTRQLDEIFSRCEGIWDTDRNRRRLYGKPGAFRPKPYGLEYRSLSNAWVNYPLLYPFIAACVTQAFFNTQRGIQFKSLPQKHKKPGSYNRNAHHFYYAKMSIPENFKKVTINDCLQR